MWLKDRHAVFDEKWKWSNFQPKITEIFTFSPSSFHQEITAVFHCPTMLRRSDSKKASNQANTHLRGLQGDFRTRITFHLILHMIEETKGLPNARRVSKRPMNASLIILRAALSDILSPNPFVQLYSCNNLQSATSEALAA